MEWKRPLGAEEIEGRGGKGPHVQHLGEQQRGPHVSHEPVVDVSEGSQLEAVLAKALMGKGLLTDNLGQRSLEQAVRWQGTSAGPLHGSLGNTSFSDEGPQSTPPTKKIQQPCHSHREHLVPTLQLQQPMYISLPPSLPSSPLPMALECQKPQL